MLWICRTVGADAYRDLMRHAGTYGLRAPWFAGGPVHLSVALIFLPALLRLPQVTRIRASESEVSD
jgi:hypothetical protein